MTTRADAIAAAAWILAAARAERDAMTPDAAARAAYVPGGPSVAELAARIRAHRAAARAGAAA